MDIQKLVWRARHYILFISLGQHGIVLSELLWCKYYDLPVDQYVHMINVIMHGSFNTFMTAAAIRVIIQIIIFVFLSMVFDKIKTPHSG